MKIVLFKLIAVIMALYFISCMTEPKGKEDDTEINLGIPKNVSINVQGRLMTVTWDAVNNALGYEIITTSVGCGSGNRTINTKEKTAVATSNGSVASNVKINDGNSIEITLMASTPGSSVAMASSVTAKVKSLGGTVSEVLYFDSEYSETVNKVIEK